MTLPAIERRFFSEEEQAVRIRSLKGHSFPVLSKGSIELVDAMGSDRRIVEAARTTSQIEGKTDTDDENLIRYLRRHRHCYDEATEVLTDQGFMRWSAVLEYQRTEIKLGLWDPLQQSLSYEHAESFTCQDYTGAMYQVQHGGVDLLVTPEHKLYVKYGQGSKFMTEYALLSTQAVGHRSMVRYSKLAPYNRAPSFDAKTLDVTCDSSQAFLRLVGFFIGDGALGSTEANCLTFRLKKERKRSYLRELCLELGWEYRETTYPRISVSSPDSGIGHLFRKLFGAEGGGKQVPRIFQQLNAEDSAAILDGLRNSDGTSKRSTWEYSTSVGAVADAVQLIALHAGEAAHVCYKSCGMLSVMFLTRMREPVVNQGNRNTSETTYYSGKVYCATTRTGILVVRRNGKIVLCGNSTPTEFNEVVLRVKVPMDTWRQWIRHRMASVNEFSSRYSDVPDENDTTNPDQWRLQSQGNRQGSSGNVVTQWPVGTMLVTDKGTFYVVEGGLVVDGNLPPKPRPLDPAAIIQTVNISLRDGPVFSPQKQPVTPGSYLCEREEDLHKRARFTYEERLAFGVAKEVARKDLCLSQYTVAYWKMDLHNLFHFLGLRMDSHAQQEIRQYANIIGEEIVARLFPISWYAFLDYNLNALTLSAIDQGILQRMVTDSRSVVPYSYAAFLDAQPREWAGKSNVRERDEALAKFCKLGLVDHG